MFYFVLMPKYFTCITTETQPTKSMKNFVNVFWESTTGQHLTYIKCVYKTRQKRFILGKFKNWNLVS